VILTMGCANLTPPSLQSGEEPFDEIHSGPYASANPAEFTTTPLPASAYKPRWFFLAGRAPRRAPVSVLKLDAALAQRLMTPTPGALDTLLVNFVERIPTPRFPTFESTSSRDSVGIASKVSQATVLIQALEAQRAVLYQADTTGFAANYRARVLKTFWLSQTALIEAPRDRDHPVRETPVDDFRARDGRRVDPIILR
jgi:hypothetical protein